MGSSLHQPASLGDNEPTFLSFLPSHTPLEPPIHAGVVAACSLSSCLSVSSARIEQTRRHQALHRALQARCLDFFFSLPKGPDVILGTARKGQESGRSYFHCSPSLAHSHPSDLALEPSTASPPTCSPNPHPQALPWVSTVCVNV